LQRVVVECTRKRTTRRHDLRFFERSSYDFRHSTSFGWENAGQAALHEEGCSDIQQFWHKVECGFHRPPGSLAADPPLD
jgi:hypothetical protein